MGLQTIIKGYTAWANVRLVRSDCETNDIIRGIMQDIRMKVLLQDIAGTVPRGMDTMDKLSMAQKATRVNWFVDTLKKYEKLPKLTKVDSTSFSLCSPPDVLDILQQLLYNDVATLSEVAQTFQKRKVTPQVIIAKSLPFGSCKITKPVTKPPSTAGVASQRGKSRSNVSMTTKTSSSSDPFDIDAPYLLLRLVNGQLKNTLEGRRLHVKSFEELVDSRVLCALLNSLVPNTFTSEVLLNDRWTINLVLDSASEMFRVTSSVDSHDLYQNDTQGMCGFLTYIIMCGYQYRQASAVVQRIKELKLVLEELKAELEKHKSASIVIPKKVEWTNKKITYRTEELSGVESAYDCEECKSWMKHVETIQANIRAKIADKMSERFDVLTVPRPMTINDLCESYVISLSLTRGNGFYLSSGKERMWPDRRLVVCVKESGDYYEDFSGRENKKGTVKKMLGISSDSMEQINPDHHSDYEIYFESPTRNKILQGGMKFLYQVFPGTVSQCERLLLRAAHAGDITTVQKLMVFFSDKRDFVNCGDHETGNSALHLASRQGHFDIALHLLESGANVNLCNNAGNTPLFLSTEGLYRQLSQLLLEWGTDIHIKNRISKTAMDLIRNMDMKAFLEDKYKEYRELAHKLTKQKDVELVALLETTLKNHAAKKNCLASLRSRCVKGDTLFHRAAWLNSVFGVEFFTSKHIGPDIQNVNKATPLHHATDPAIIQYLLEHEADVNAVDVNGDTPMHLLCNDVSSYSDMPQAIRILVSNSAQLDIPNNQGWLPIHCAASHGLVDAVETILSLDKDGVLDFLKEEDVDMAGLQESDVSCPSLVYVSLLGRHLKCALWLASNGYGMKEHQADELLLKLLTDPPSDITDVVDTVAFLLAQGADPDALYTGGNRPLHLLATMLHLPELGVELLGAGALVDCRNNDLATPLCCACKENNLFLAKILIDKGADCHAIDIRAKRPFDYIQDHQEWIDSGHFSDEIRALLKAFSLRQAKAMVQSISNIVHTNSVRLSRDSH